MLKGHYQICLDWSLTVFEVLIEQLEDYVKSQSTVSMSGTIKYSFRVWPLEILRYSTFKQIFDQKSYLPILIPKIIFYKK